MGEMIPCENMLNTAPNMIAQLNRVGRRRSGPRLIRPVTTVCTGADKDRSPPPLAPRNPESTECIGLGLLRGRRVLRDGLLPRNLPVMRLGRARRHLCVGGPWYRSGWQLQTVPRARYGPLRESLRVQKTEAKAVPLCCADPFEVALTRFQSDVQKLLRKSYPRKYSSC